MSKKVLIIGTGLGALSTALRLSRRGYQIEMVEKYHKAGGRLNLLEKDGFKWDLAPTFFSMSYEFDELMKDAGMKKPFSFIELDPLYSVHFEGDQRKYLIYKNLDKLEAEFEDLEPGFKKRMEKFLDKTGKVFHDTENIIIKKNFNSLIHYLLSMSTVPWKHAPGMITTMWDELGKHFSSFEVKVIFSLVGFFLGSTPFDTPAVFTLLTYTELKHDGYYNVEGGMYKIVEGLVSELKSRGVSFHYNVEIIDYYTENAVLKGFIDQNGKKWTADRFVVNADAAAFRGGMFKREKYSPAKLDELHWTMAPLTIYLGIKGKLDSLYHHNYFLRRNFQEYANRIFKNSIGLDKPYYYLNMPSAHNPDYAPEGHESLFILCPVPDLRYKPNWDDVDQIADGIIHDLSQRIEFDIQSNIVSKTILSPIQWEKMFNLYRGSGLGLAHDLSQVGYFRPSNQDEVFPNLFYVGASTTPGTGLPMVVISSKLVTERILKYDGVIS